MYHFTKGSSWSASLYYLKSILDDLLLLPHFWLASLQLKTERDTDTQQHYKLLLLPKEILTTSRTILKTPNLLEETCFSAKAD